MPHPFYLYRASAEKRNIPFCLSFKEFESYIFKDCHYCQSKPYNFIKDFGLYYNGIDRIDNTRGYETCNCVTCCRICNACKRTLEINEWHKISQQMNITKNAIFAFKRTNSYYAVFFNEIGKKYAKFLYPTEVNSFLVDFSLPITYIQYPNLVSTI